MDQVLGSRSLLGGALGVLGLAGTDAAKSGKCKPKCGPCATCAKGTCKKKHGKSVLQNQWMFVARWTRFGHNSCMALGRIAGIAVGQPCPADLRLDGP